MIRTVINTEKLFVWTLIASCMGVIAGTFSEAEAADTYDIHALLPLTGGAALVGLDGQKKSSGT